MFIDNPTLCSTDIIPMINEAWTLSFARVQNNRKAISKRGWGSLNGNLLLYKELLPTMTKPDRESFKLQLSRPPEVLNENNFISLGSSIDLKKSLSTEFSFTRDITMPESTQACDKTILSLNYSSVNSATVLDTLIGSHDVQEARMRNKINKQKGIETSN